MPQQLSTCPSNAIRSEPTCCSKMRFESTSPLQASIVPIQSWALECRSSGQDSTPEGANRQSAKLKWTFRVSVQQILPSKARFSSSSLNVRADAQSGRGTRIKKKKTLRDVKCKSGWWWTGLALPECGLSFGAFEWDSVALECELRFLLIFGRLDLRSSIFVLLHCRIFIVFHTTHTSPIGIYRYIHLLDNGISTFLYCTSLITLWRTEYLHTARLSIGSTSYIRNPWWFMFHAEAFFYKCPLSRSLVKQLLGSHVRLFLDNMSMIAMVFVTCNRPTAILLWHRKVIAGWPVFAHQSPMSVGVLFGIKNAPYLEGV